MRLSRIDFRRRRHVRGNSRPSKDPETSPRPQLSSGRAAGIRVDLDGRPRARRRKRDCRLSVERRSRELAAQARHVSHQMQLHAADRQSDGPDAHSLYPSQDNRRRLQDGSGKCAHGSEAYRHGCPLHPLDARHHAAADLCARRWVWRRRHGRSLAGFRIHGAGQCDPVDGCA